MPAVALTGNGMAVCAFPVASTSGRSAHLLSCAAHLHHQQVYAKTGGRSAGRQALLAVPRAAAEPVSASLPEEAVAGWQEAVQVLEQRLELNPAVIETVLRRAFGWGPWQGYWRQQKVEEVPSGAKVEAVLDLLESVGIGFPEEQAKIVQSFPEILGCELSLLEGNVETLRSKWNLKGSVLAGTVKRKPAVLGSTVDCEGNCISECNRCWVRF